MTRPRYPHPWLASCGRLGMFFGIAVGVAAAGLLFLPTGTSANSPALTWLVAWQKVASVGDGWEVACSHFEGLAAAVVAPLVWLLAAGLLRLAATGRMAKTGPPHGLVRTAHTLAVVGMAVSLLAIALGAARWFDPVTQPEIAGAGVAVRFVGATDSGQSYRFAYEPAMNDSAWPVQERSRHSPRRTTVDKIWRVARSFCAEVYSLSIFVRLAGVSFCLCGVVYCLGRPGHDAET